MPELLLGQAGAAYSTFSFSSERACSSRRRCVPRSMPPARSSCQQLAAGLLCADLRRRSSAAASSRHATAWSRRQRPFEGNRKRRAASKLARSLILTKRAGALMIGRVLEAADADCYRNSFISIPKILNASSSNGSFSFFSNTYLPPSRCIICHAMFM